MRTLFISDIHLSEQQPHLFYLFETFMNSHAIHSDKIYILGDLFDAWFGEENHFTQRVFALLKKITQMGKPIFVMPGNRDFLLDKHFEHETGCHLLADPSLIHVGSKTILLSHGDSYCSDDKAHQIFRKITRTSLFKKIFLSLPLSIRCRLAIKARNTSKNRTKTLSIHVMDVTEKSVLQDVIKHQTYHLIHGHTHLPGMELIKYKNTWIERITLSDWGETGNYFEILPEEERLCYFE